MNEGGFRASCSLRFCGLRKSLTTDTADVTDVVDCRIRVRPQYHLGELCGLA
jgi:hypothetical protein